MAWPGLVIFDCDGVLVDSEPLSAAVLAEVLAEAGCPLGVDVIYDRFLGRSLASTMQVLRDEFDLELTDSHLATLRARLYDRFRAELRPIPGVAEAIRALRCPLCVASSSQPERIALSLSLTGLAPLFGDHVYSATMVKRGKPFPDLFLHAAREMNVPPEQCVVIEDSQAGVGAAQSAGMQVIAFTGGGHAGPASLQQRIRPLGPSALLDNMADLPETLQSLV